MSDLAATNCGCGCEDTCQGGWDAVTADVVYVRTADVASAEIPVVLLSGS